MQLDGISTMRPIGRIGLVRCIPIPSQRRVPDTKKSASLPHFDATNRLRPGSSLISSPLLRTMATSETIDLSAFRLHDKDTGSADVQIALLTDRINQLTEHLKENRKDHSSRRGLLKLVATRRSMLDYLKRTSQDRYKTVIERLNLRK